MFAFKVTTVGSSLGFIVPKAAQDYLRIKKGDIRAMGALDRMGTLEERPLGLIRQVQITGLLEAARKTTGVNTGALDHVRQPATAKGAQRRPYLNPASAAR